MNNQFQDDFFIKDNFADSLVEFSFEIYESVFYWIGIGYEKIWLYSLDCFLAPVVNPLKGEENKTLRKSQESVI